MSEQSDVTVRELNDLILAMREQRVKIEESERATSELNKQLTAMESKAVAYLEALNLESYKCPHGLIRVDMRWRVKLPQTDDDRSNFFNYLREKGVFDRLITVNSNSLNSYWGQEKEIADKEGRGFDFGIPGIGEPSLFKKLSFRKG